MGGDAGATPDKELAVHIVRLDDDLEILALSAEPTVDWQHILDEACPRLPQGIRLYTGYLGAVFGYLPTAKQVTEGGYEVNGFQRLFETPTLGALAAAVGLGVIGRSPDRRSTR